jgi:hypothetical protein
MISRNRRRNCKWPASWIVPAADIQQRTERYTRHAAGDVCLHEVCGTDYLTRSSVLSVAAKAGGVHRLKFASEALRALHPSCITLFMLRAGSCGQLNRA